MFEQQEPFVAPISDVNMQENEVLAAAPLEIPAAPSAALPSPPENGEMRNQRAEAGRKGANRVHQLIREGKLYEAEHGLKSGRQRLHQLLELGKLYEREHGTQPTPKNKRRERLTRADREELLATFLRCVVRLAKPSFRAELIELIALLQKENRGQAA